ncbi:HlyD family secretion protein [Maritalea mobilis]|uniref:HlyD family efflux transporter periplasmic adaptor subunit n=1 Tax=Maritalea mobilis TaxID=483324 RepID=UPI001C965D16|nr:HlyD family secretion protein [Maritalea mobilis]MBY6201677.1 HlyD family secretion protein [Maritalea mobilis]
MTLETKQHQAPDHKGIQTIKRSSTLYHAIQLPFFVVLNDVILDGHSLSLEEFDAHHAPSWQREGDEFAIDVGTRTEVRLRISLYGFVCEVTVLAEVIEIIEDREDRVIRFAFRDMSRQTREALRRISRSYHAGYVASPSDLLENQDPQTLNEKKDEPAPEDARLKWRRVVGMGLSVGVIVGTFAFIGTALYERFVLINASFATITAPKVEMISADMGQVRTPIEAVGQILQRDDPIYEISSAELSSEEASLVAQIDYLTEINEEMQNDPEVLALSPAGIPFSSPAEVRRALALAEGELRALQLRIAELQGFSPCDCMVSWFQEDGAWVVPGDTVAVLARTESEALRVEALVHVSQIEDVHIGQSAVVTDEATGRTIPARVERITLDPRQQPRVGFPQWLRQEPTVASVMLSIDEALDPGMIGQPMQVAIRRTELLGFGLAAADQ